MGLVPTWPIDQLPPEKPNWEIVGGYVSGGAQNQQGWVQRGIFGGGGTWRWTATRIVVSDDPDQRVSWRALQAILDSGASPVIISCPDWAGVEELWPADEPVDVFFSDGEPFSDGGGFTSCGIQIVSAAAAVINATTFNVRTVYGPALLPGFDFSVADAQGLPRRHRIRAVAPTADPAVTTITIRPWLRDAIASGAELNFSNPGCVMKLAEPQSIFAEETGGRWAEPSPIFEEWFGTIPT